MDALRLLRRILFSVRVVLFVVVGVPILMCGAVALMYTWLFGDGSLHVVAAADGTSVFVDGSLVATLAAGEHQELKLSQGDHKVRIVTDGVGDEMPVHVSSGFTEDFIGGSKDRCYVQLDVTDFYYEGTVKLPVVEKKFHGDEVVSVSGATVYDEASLPSKIDENSHERMILEASCDALNLSDADLVGSLGFSLDQPAAADGN